MILMSFRRAWLNVLIFGLSFVANFAAATQPLPDGTCDQGSKRVSLMQVEASAAHMANFFKRSESIRVQSEMILKHALMHLSQSHESGWIEFRSIPDLASQKPQTYEDCALLFERTTELPISFETQYFKSLEALNAWIQDFSQGKGTMGRQLYQACPGKCSPQYTWSIRQSESHIKVDTNVVCGMPRNRETHLYKLSTALHTSTCPG